MAASLDFRKVKRRIAAAATFFAAMIPATNYHLNHFYVRGGYFLDSGFFAFLTTQSTKWPPLNPPAIGGNWFSTHFSPILYLQAALYKLGPAMPSPVFFSLSQGAWYGIIALSVFLLLADRSVALAALLGVLGAFNGVALAALGFPHIEIGIPAALMLFFALYFNGHARLACLALLIGFSIREDAGLHYFGVFFLLALALKLNAREGAHHRVFFRLAAASLAIAVASMILQKALFPATDDALARVYLGTPAFKHVTAAFIDQRARFYLAHRLYVLVPIALGLALAAIRKNAILAAGFASTIPWISLSAIAASDGAGALVSYYSFPVIISVLWPAIAWRLRSKTERRPAGVFELTLVLCASIGFFAGAGGNHDDRPWTSFGFQWPRTIRKNQHALEQVFAAKGLLGRFIVDDAVAAIMPGDVARVNWRGYTLSMTKNDLAAIDALVFQPGDWQDARTKEIVRDAGLDVCRVADSSYAIASRRDLAALSCPTRTLPLK